ncbi:histidine phosphatase family protein [Aliikangiella sp. IMCC44359]|uniref:histidine phosphatase family protein n=1 Tax=Aliikangiella sp. IMCC44359 TaxID=3459125 RepID=UPI00403B190C
MNDSLLTYFYLARHGETEWNKLRRLQGQLDSALTANGIDQAALLGRNLLGKNIQKIISSPLKRAQHTAEICQQMLLVDLELDSRFVERDFGLWQSAYFDDISVEDDFEKIFFQVNHISPPKGESGIACANRIKNGLVAIAEQTSETNLLVVTHGDAIRCLLATLSKQSECDAYSQYGNGRIFLVKFCHRTQQLLVD